MVDPLRLPGYEVERLAGSGGTGEVWVAREEAGGRRVALKRVRDAGAEERAALRREAALLAALAHPHLLSLRAVVDSSDDVVLVLDLAEGGSLRDLVDARGRLSTGEVVTAAAPIAQALAEVHRAGLVHGDVTPGNILFTRDGRPLLGDLGVARIAGLRPDRTGATAAYAAPEVLAGAAPTPPADVFGLASVALAALTGSLPASWDDAAAETLSVLPAVSLDLLDRALSSRPDRRPDAAALAEGLFGLARPLPVRLGRADPSAPGPGAVAAADGTAAAAPAAGGGPAAEVTHTVRGGDSGAGAHGGAPGAPAAPAAPRVAPASPPAARGIRRLTADPASGEDEPAQPAHHPTHHVRPAPAEPAAAAGADPPTGRRPRWAGRRRVVVLALGALLVVAGLLAALLVRGDRQPGTPAAAVAGAPCADPSARSTPRRAPSDVSRVDWTTVITALYARRSEAFSKTDPALLCDVFAAGAPGLTRDLGKIERYRARGVHADGLSWEVVDAVADGRDGTAVVVEVTDRLGPYTVRKAGGDVVARSAGLDQRTWRAALVRLDEGWRFR